MLDEPSVVAYVNEGGRKVVYAVGAEAKQMYDLLKKFDISEKESAFIRFCSNYMGVEELSPGIVGMYDCTSEESRLIIRALNW